MPKNSTLSVFPATVKQEGNKTIIEFSGDENVFPDFIPVKKGKVFCTITDGVIQISGKQPYLTIPPLCLDKNSFHPQAR